MIKKLFDILPVDFETKIIGDSTRNISGIEIDSRGVKDGFVYAALRGTKVDGHAFINNAISNGAVCIICEEAAEIQEGITYIVTKDVRSFLG